ncbi:MAG: hypothetical protein LAO30_06205 [Acidobacteriia bacterium]|nr:hypothetical protein [Terriglobia bacterium]
MTTNLRAAAKVLGVVFAAVTLVSAKDAKISAEELVAKHLQSIGSPENRAAAKSRMSQGKVVFSEIINRNLHVEGASSVVSQGHKFKCSFKFAVSQYPGEQLVFDGQKVMVGMIDATSRSNLGTFLYLHDELLHDGLFGGALSTGWLLLDAFQSGAKLKYEGMHKIDGRPLHDLRYLTGKSRANEEMSIHLYFDPATYRHVMTVYTLTIRNSSGLASEGTDETQQTLEERFDDFRPVEGLTLPRHWVVRYTVTPQSKEQEYQWDSSFESVSQNNF